MKKIITLILVTLTIATIGIKMHSDKQIRTEWEEDRQIDTIVISSGDDLWSIAEEYKPSWMDCREYIYEVKELNNMTQSGLYAGEQLLIYVI